MRAAVNLHVVVDSEVPHSANGQAAEKRMHTKKLVRTRAAMPALATGLLGSLVSATAGAATGYAATVPTVAGALAADRALATAIGHNDAKGIENLLADDWVVVATSGGIGKGKYVFPDGIKSGALVRKSYELSDVRVRLYGDVAIVTSKVATSGVFGGRAFDVIERQTDVLLWKSGYWKCVLTHETKLDEPRAHSTARK